MTGTLTTEELEALTKLRERFDTNKLSSTFLIHMVQNYIDVPFCISIGIGEFLWVNNAWAEMLEYSVTELVENPNLNWKTLTYDSKDLAIDEEQVKLLEDGSISENLFIKKYRQKSGTSITVKLSVKRFPSQGNCIFFICTATKLDEYQRETINLILDELKDSNNQMMLWNKRIFKTLRKIEKDLAENTKHEFLAILANILNRLYVFADKYPKITIMVIMLIFSSIFGETASTIVDKVLNIANKLEEKNVNPTP